MSMSTHVVGFRPPDETWQKMKAAWDACCLAGVNPPTPVASFFGPSGPDPSGVDVDIRTAVKSYSDDNREGFEVDLTKLPPGLTALRFWNSW